MKYLCWSNDEAVEALFKKVSDENNGKLDVLVNNAYAGVILIGEQVNIQNISQNTEKNLP